jgi:phage FluMu protein Com
VGDKQVEKERVDSRAAKEGEMIMGYVIECRKCNKPFRKFSNGSWENACPDCRDDIKSRKIYSEVFETEVEEMNLNELQEDVDRLREEVRRLYAANMSLEEGLHQVLKGDGEAFDDIATELVQVIAPRMDKWVVTLNNRIKRNQKYTIFALGNLGWDIESRKSKNFLERHQIGGHAIDDEDEDEKIGGFRFHTLNKG